METSVEPVSLLADDPENSPEWPLFYDLREVNCSSLHGANNGRTSFKSDGLRFKGNWKRKSYDHILGTPFDFEDGGFITHELAVYRGRIERLAKGLIIAPNYCVQYGNANEDATENRCQILKGRNIVWRGWDEHPAETTWELRQELIDQIERFHEVLKRYIGRR